MTQPSLITRLTLQHFLNILWRVGWLSLLVGFCLEVLLQLVNVSFGDTPNWKNFLTGLAQKEVWAFMVCLALVLVQPQRIVMLLVGLVFAPVSWLSASAVRQLIKKPLGIAGTSLLTLATLWVALLRGVEYAVLATLLVILLNRQGRKRDYALTGGLIGAIFGGFNLLVLNQPVGMAQVVGSSLNEILFPIACSLVVRTGQLAKT
jgi:hypothetical protein